MIRFTQGNLLEARVDALVNTVNTVGVMGKGIALMFKERYPENFKAYAAASKAETVQDTFKRWEAQLSQNPEAFYQQALSSYHE